LVNCTAMTKTIASTVAFTHVYEYDDANRLVLSEVEGLTNVDDQAYTWDANGNLLSDGTRTFTYTVANRLTQVVSGTVTTPGGSGIAGLRGFGSYVVVRHFRVFNTPGRCRAIDGGREVALT